jgi:hypothetical protein
MWTLVLLVFAGSAAAQPLPPDRAITMAQVFAEGLQRLGLLFQRIGSLSGVSAVGTVWSADVRTGEQHRISNAADLACPVPSADGATIYALRGHQIVRIVAATGQDTSVGGPVEWRKLLGVLQEGTLLGFVEGDPRPHPALVAPNGILTELAPPANESEQKRNGVLLQEERDYTDGARLEVRQSAHGGRGRDVYIIVDTQSRNLTDCGDDVCGQPSRSLDGFTILFIRWSRK